ncbi:hypothetical protein BC832DRAFT_114217 [Gaertneriomyces semiglobifer]|nr:hypothetical protein BC832DRAFT_114217 [Gaertneriomyces semiglobifer]
MPGTVIASSLPPALQSAVDVLDRSVLVPLVGRKCAHTITSSISRLSINPADPQTVACAKLLVSKILGLGIVLGGSILKVPQILKIVGAGSVEGLSFIGNLLETIAYSISLAYNWRSGNPWSTFGEMGFITMQDVFILFLILGYSKNVVGMCILAIAYSAFAYALATPEILDHQMLVTLQWSTVLLGIFSKLPQIMSNFLASSTGQLSAITVFLQFAGSAARVFTTLQEVDDQVLLISNLVASALNGVLVLQMLAYWSTSKPAPKLGHVPKKGSGQKKKSPKAL